ncbi:hypothetical protein PMAYCL1PPCAC_11186, partial [Pristionchus mayeri]
FQYCCKSCRPVIYATTTAKPLAACQSCSQSLISITAAGVGAHAFASDVTTAKDGCSVRTFTCKGNGAAIEINAGDGVFSDEGD